MKPGGSLWIFSIYFTWWCDKQWHQDRNHAYKMSTILFDIATEFGYAISVSVPYSISLTYGVMKQERAKSLRWRHNRRDGVSNHQPPHCLLNRLFRRRSKKTSKRRVTGLCAGNSQGTGEFPTQMANNAENISISWRHHVTKWSREFKCWCSCSETSAALEKWRILYITYFLVGCGIWQQDPRGK